MLKKIILAVLLLTGIGFLVSRATSMYFNAFGGPVTTPDNTGHWQSIKETFGWAVARDLDTPEIIQERQKDIT